LDNAGNIIKRHSLLTMKNVKFEVIAWAPSQADVDLSIACMFEREMPGSLLSGGLLQFNQAIGGALTKLRDEGSFRAQEMETLLLRPALSSVRAHAILIIGLGNPLAFSSAILERALRVAFREAVRFGASTVAFAPNLIDAGQIDVTSLQVEAAMVRGVVGALQAEHRLVELGLADPPAIRSWAFDTGPAHFDTAAKKFLKAFTQSSSGRKEGDECK
jgi:hypothetical protein